MSIYPPDTSPDPFVYDGTRHESVARAIFDRFTAGDSILDLALDYKLDARTVEHILRWGVARLRSRRRRT